MLAVGEIGESSGRKRGTGQGGEKKGRVSGALSAPLSLLAQEDPERPGHVPTISGEGGAGKLVRLPGVDPALHKQVADVRRVDLMLI
eukprot:1196210-Prorocentrum_minimum.AAC.3